MTKIDEVVLYVRGFLDGRAVIPSKVCGSWVPPRGMTIHIVPGNDLLVGLACQASADLNKILPNGFNTEVMGVGWERKVE